MIPIPILLYCWSKIDLELQASKIKYFVFHTVRVKNPVEFFKVKPFCGGRGYSVFYLTNDAEIPFHSVVGEIKLPETSAFSLLWTAICFAHFALCLTFKKQHFPCFISMQHISAIDISSMAGLP